MREITFWRLVFGQAFVLTVLALSLTLAEVRVLESVATFAIASLFVSGVVVWLAVEAYDAACRFGGFMAELSGLRE
ncbi:MAG: hypothetical protein OXH99_23025 [Bryobacterales bacterium]|nr:hypothetical protein [Bryobacterales bacterium]